MSIHELAIGLADQYGGVSAENAQEVLEPVFTGVPDVVLNHLKDEFEKQKEEDPRYTILFEYVSNIVG
jgi:hypothetical protein